MVAAMVGETVWEMVREMVGWSGQRRERGRVWARRRPFVSLVVT